MQVAGDLLARALDAIVQALVLAGLLAGGVIWTLKRGKAIDPRDAKTIERLERDMRRLLDGQHELGERVSTIEGQLRGARQRRDSHGG